LFQKLDDVVGLADATTWRSHLAAIAGEYDKAIAFAESLAEIAETLGDEHIASYSNLILSEALMALAVERDDPAAAQRSRELCEAELAELPKFESALHETALLKNMALVLVVLGAHSESIALGRRAMRRALEIGERHLPDQHLVLGVATGWRGNYREGVLLVAVALRQYEEEGIGVDRFQQTLMKRFERSARAALGDDDYEAAVRDGEALSDDEGIDLALTATSED